MSAAPINPMTPEQIELAHTRLAATAYQLLCNKVVLEGDGESKTAHFDTGGFLDMIAEAAASAMHTLDGALQQRCAELTHVNRDVAQISRHMAQALAHHLREGHVKECHDCKLRIANAALIQQKAAEILQNTVVVQIDADGEAAPASPASTTH
jgi:hypothetical protein